MKLVTQQTFRRVLHSLIISTCALALPINTFAQSASGGDRTPKRVFRGQEVVVSFSEPKSGFSARSTSKVTNLKLDDDMRLTKSLSRGQIGVFSDTESTGIMSHEPIEVDEANINALCEKIRRKNPNENITCEANVIIEASRTPNDSLYSNLYGMTRISAPAAWDITTGSSSVVVAVIDTGIEYTHPDLSENIAVNAGEIPGNGIDDDRNSYVDDYYGFDFVSNDSNPMDDHFHGTHCAGTVGAKGDNGRGVVGVAWTVKLLPVKVLNAYGSGTLAAVASGMNYAVARGAKILSMSLGTSSFSQTLENAIINAKNNGALVVAAAGNNGSNSDQYPHYPSASTQDNVISVAASNSSDTLASFSNWGATSVDLAAPGVDILSTYLGGQYATASGTSMATPHVAGIVAMIKGVNPSLNYLQIKSILLSTVDPISSMAGKMVSGGRANVHKAILKATESPATPTPTPAPTTTATPTPTPTPPAMETPEEEEPNELTIDRERTRRTVYVFGDVSTFQGTPDTGESVTLFCGGRSITTKKTDDEGYYEFRFKRPARPVRCFTEDTTGGRSRRITVR